MNILKWIYILYLTQIKTFKAEAVYSKLINRWTYQTNQINELASLNKTFKIGIEWEGWGQDNVAGGGGWGGVEWEEGEWLY